MMRGFVIYVLEQMEMKAKNEYVRQARTRELVTFSWICFVCRLRIVKIAGMNNVFRFIATSTQHF